MPQPPDRPPVPLPAYVDQKMADGLLDGYRYAELPPQGEAWRRGLAALDQAARQTHEQPFDALTPDAAGRVVAADAGGELTGDAWGGMPCKLFFEHRVIPDITHAYYAHPIAWNEIGFGGPGQPPRLCADGLEPPRSVGSRRGTTGSAERAAQEQPCRMIRSPRRAPRMAARPMCSSAAAGCRCGNTAMTRPSISPWSARARAAAR